MLDIRPLDGKTALVTGAQQGIGRAIAVIFAQAGANVVINYLDALPLALEVQAAVKSYGRDAITVRADVGRNDEIAQMTAVARERFGVVDILVNNAGIFPRSAALQLTESEWDDVLRVNLKGSFFCSQAIARDLVQAGKTGSIINMSSITMRGATMGAHYVASKGGLSSMTRALALELATHGIRVNAIAPGLIDTAQPRVGMTEEQIAQAGRTIPLGRIGQPEDIAQVALYLASDASRYVTGQTIHSNGGLHMP